VLAGHSANTGVHEVVIGNNVLAIGENMIRYERQRHSGVHSRIDLYMKWPQMAGYSQEYREAFNYADGDPSLLFVSFEEQIMSRDMSGRFEPIYSKLIIRPGESGPAGLVIYKFTEKSGYTNELLVTGTKSDGTLFVARCPEKGDTLASCERDILIGDNLSLAYRFPRSKLKEWRAIDSAVLASARRFLKTATPAN
jgi:hypothetical protein